MIRRAVVYMVNRSGGNWIEPPSDSKFANERGGAQVVQMQCAVCHESGFSGAPRIGDQAAWTQRLKLGIDPPETPFDPDTGDRTVGEESVSRARVYLKKRFPALAEAPLVEARVCQYEDTPSADFLIDRHPDFDNVWLAGGGSGHGFKLGPAVGEYVAGVSRRRGPTRPPDPATTAASPRDSPRAAPPVR
jgi:glycine/D-amino acid oxidase-like deaminating enzyme